MEFVRGRNLGSLAPPEFIAHLETPLHAFRLGQMMVFDMLCHNSDRLPCGLFSNEGNAGNVMLPFAGFGQAADSAAAVGPLPSAILGAAIPIDNQFVSFARDRPQGVAYLSRVAETLSQWDKWLTDLCSALDSDQSSIQENVSAVTSVDSDSSRAASAALWSIASIATAAPARHTLASMHLFCRQWAPDSGLPHQAALPLFLGLVHTAIAAARMEDSRLEAMQV
jgi:hypothetical protein